MNKFQWNLNRNAHIFIQDNAFESVVWEMEAVLSRPQCVKLLHHKQWHGWHLRHSRIWHPVPEWPGLQPERQKPLSLVQISDVLAQLHWKSQLKPNQPSAHSGRRKDKYNENLCKQMSCTMHPKSYGQCLCFLYFVLLLWMGDYFITPYCSGFLLMH